MSAEHTLEGVNKKELGRLPMSAEHTLEGVNKHEPDSIALVVGQAKACARPTLS